MRNNSSRNNTDGTAKGRRRGFNFIDFLLILFAVAIVLTAINIVSPMSLIDKLKADDSYTIHYTVEITGVGDEFLDKINENDTVVDAVSKFSLGSVEAVDYTVHSTLEYNESQGDGAGEGVLATHKDKYDILVTVKANASYMAEKGYFVGDRRIAVGEKMTLRFPDYVGEGYCIARSVED